MDKKQKPIFKNEFEADVYHGLTSNPKKLSSKFFYDKKGDELFQQIMQLPEYYLTDCEYGILEEYRIEIGKIFSGEKGFDLIELGAGDGKKTKILLKTLLEEGIPFKYHPVDISENVLQQLAADLEEEFPKIAVAPKTGTYAEVLEELGTFNNQKKVIMFLGSNIGNLTPSETTDFLSSISRAMGKEDLLFIGFDQKKHPQTILDAYNDTTGVTEAFNKNLLFRINRELGANFKPEHFTHWTSYNPENGILKSFLVSEKEQTIQIKSLDLEVCFKAWESIHTELSRKFDETTIHELAQKSGLTMVKSFSDKKDYFRNYTFKKSPAL